MTERSTLWRRLVSAAAQSNGASTVPDGLCRCCAEVLGVFGTAITLMGADGAAVARYSSGDSTEALQDLQFTLGHGPTTDAHSARLAVAELDLGAQSCQRWPGFVNAALDAGVAAVFAFPLSFGAARIGVLTVYGCSAGALDPATYGDALVLAEMVTRLILGWQAASPEGSLAAELGDHRSYRAAVHQATGRISAQLDVGIGEALALLRARAFATSLTVDDIADDVNAGRLRFDD